MDKRLAREPFPEKRQAAQQVSAFFKPAHGVCDQPRVQVCFGDPPLPTLLEEQLGFAVASERGRGAAGHR
jgi:hypothetical protein